MQAGRVNLRRHVVIEKLNVRGRPERFAADSRSLQPIRCGVPNGSRERVERKRPEEDRKPREEAAAHTPREAEAVRMRREAVAHMHREVGAVRTHRAAEVAAEAAAEEAPKPGPRR